MYSPPGDEAESDGALAEVARGWWFAMGAVARVILCGCGVIFGPLRSVPLGAEEPNAPVPAVVVKSIPSDLEFDLVGPKNLTVRHGRTPATLEGLEPGKYRAIFRQPGSIGQRYTFTVGPGSTEVMGDFTLQDELEKLRQEAGEQQAIITKGVAINQTFGPPFLQALALASLKNPPIRDLLAKYGFRVALPGGGSSSGAEKAATPAPPPIGSEATPAPKVEQRTSPAEKGNEDTPAATVGLTAPPAAKDDEVTSAPKVGPATPAPATKGFGPATATALLSSAPPAAVELRLPGEVASQDWDAQREKEWTDGLEAWQKLVTNRKGLVAQCKQLEEKLQSILEDLLELAETNADAARIVDKWGIKRQ